MWSTLNFLGTHQKTKFDLAFTFVQRKRTLTNNKYLHVSTVGISAVNMRKSIQKKRQPALLNALDDSLPMPKYNSPIKMPTLRWEISRNRVNV